MWCSWCKNLYMACKGVVMSDCPNQSPKKHIPKSWVCERNSLLSFSFVISFFFFFYFIPWRRHCWQGHTVFFFYLFLTPCFQILMCFFIVLYCKDVLNTGDRVTNNALKYDRSLLICRDYFLRIGFNLWMCVFLWNVTVKM